MFGCSTMIKYCVYANTCPSGHQAWQFKRKNVGPLTESCLLHMGAVCACSEEGLPCGTGNKMWHTTGCDVRFKWKDFIFLTICRCITYVILFKTVVIHLTSFFRETTSNCGNQRYEILVPKLWVLGFTVVNRWNIQLVSANKQLMPLRSWPCGFLLSDICVWSDRCNT